MTYTAYEESRDTGTPIELYEFIQGTKRWNFVSGVNSITRQGQTFNPSSIQRDGVKLTSDVFKGAITISMPRGDSFASQFIAIPPEETTSVTIYRGHYGDADSEFVVYWKGRIVGVKTSGNQIDLECESVFTSIKRPGLRACYEYGCRHALYLKGCNVNRELYRLSGSVLSISNGLVVTVQGAASQADDYFTGGILVAPDGASRFLTAHTGDTVTLTSPIVSLAGEQTVSLYPGCNHLKETCLNKFSNLNNFGGFPWIPSTNPYSSTIV